MNTHTCITLLAALIFGCSAAHAEEQPTSSPKTVHALADLKVFSDAPLPVTRKDLLAIKRGIPTDVSITQINDAEPVADSVVLTLRVEVDASGDESPTAKEDLYAFIDTLKNRLKEHHHSMMQRFESRHRIYVEAIDQAEAHLRELQTRQNKIAGDMPMDKQAVLQRQMEKARAITEMDLQRTVLGKRLEELSDQIAETQAEVNGRIDHDELLKNLREMLAQQEIQLENVMRERQPNDKSIIPGMNELREKLMASKMRLAERRRQLEMEAGGDRLQDLNRQLRDTTMQLEELETHQEMLAGTDPGSLSKSSDYEILDIKINAAKENLHNAIMEKNEYERQMKLIQPPTVTIEYIHYLPASTDEP